jgi:hypothetical protein
MLVGIISRNLFFIVYRNSSLVDTISASDKGLIEKNNQEVNTSFIEIF